MKKVNGLRRHAKAILVLGTVAAALLGGLISPTAAGIIGLIVYVVLVLYLFR